MLRNALNQFCHIYSSLLFGLLDCSWVLELNVADKYKLQVEKGDIMDSKMLAGLFAGKEAVVSCLGFPRAAPVT